MAKTRTDTESVLRLVINGQQAMTSTKELRDSFRKLNTELQNMREADNPRVYKEKTAQVQALKRAWDESRKSVSGNTQEVKGLKSSMQDIAKGVFAGNLYTRGFDLAVKGITNFVKHNAELSDVMAGVVKTTGLTEEAVDRLNEKFKRIDTRTANTALLGLAEVAGRLGYTMEHEVEGFVRAADKIGVALGDELGGVEDAVRSIGKLVDIFGVGDNFELEDALLKVGSAINELGMAGTANERTMIDFAQRLAGIAPAAGISLDAILGLGAAVDELGQPLEASSTAIGQFIVKMGADIPKFAKIAGMSVGDFAKLLREDANEAFLTVLENAASTTGGIEELAANMDMLGIAGARGIAALGVLANNTDKVRDRQRLSNAAFDDGVSILEEFDNVNNTLGANLDKIGNRLRVLWENSDLRDFFTDLTAVMADGRTELDRLMGDFEQARSTVTALERDTVPLINRYEELSSKTNLTDAEHRELHSILRQLSDQYPIAVSEMDAYGNALSLNTDVLRANVEEHRNYLRYINQKAIAEAKDHQEGLKRRKERLEAEIREKRVTEWLGAGGTGGGGGQLITRDLSNEELRAKRDELGRLTSDISAINTQLTQLGDETTKVFQDYERAFSQSALDSADKIQARIEELTAARSEAVAGSQAYIEAEQGIAMLQKRLQAMNAQGVSETGGTGAGKVDDAKKKADQQREQARKEYEKLLADFGALDAQRLLDQLGAAEREIAVSEAKYDKLITQAEDFIKREGTTAEQRAEAEEKIRLLREQREQASLDIQSKQTEAALVKIHNLRESMEARRATELDRERVRINKFYDDLIRQHAGQGEVIAELEAARDRDLTDAKLREAERLKAERERLEREYSQFGLDERDIRLADINAKYDQEIEALKGRFNAEMQLTEEFQAAMAAIEEGRRHEEKKLDEATWKERVGYAIESAQIVSDTLFQIMSNNIRAESDARMNEYRKQRESELNNRRLTESQKKAINDKYDALERREKLRSWQAQKRADMGQAVIATALGVARSIPNWVQMAIAAGAGAAQVAVIAAQRPPQFGRGGLLPSGPSHAQGGIDLWDTRRQELVGNIEGGEPILSRETYRNNKPIVDELLYSSMRRNGASIQINPALMDADRIVRSGGMAMGHHTGGAGQREATTRVVVDTINMERMVKDLVQAVAKSDSKTVVLSNRMLEDHTDRVVRIRNEADA